MLLTGSRKHQSFGGNPCSCSYTCSPACTTGRGNQWYWIEAVSTKKAAVHKRLEASDRVAGLSCSPESLPSQQLLLECGKMTQSVGHTNNVSVPAKMNRYESWARAM